MPGDSRGFRAVSSGFCVERLRNPTGSRSDLPPALVTCTRAQPGVRGASLTQGPPRHLGPTPRARRRPAPTQETQDSSKMKSHFVPHAVLGPPPSNGIRSRRHRGAPEAQKSPMALICASRLPRADSRLRGRPAFICQTRASPCSRAGSYTCTARIYIAVLRDGIDLGRVNYKHKLIKNCIMAPYRNTGEKQINTSAAGTAIAPLPPRNRLVTSNYKP